MKALYRVGLDSSHFQEPLAIKLLTTKWENFWREKGGEIPVLQWETADTDDCLNTFEKLSLDLCCLPLESAPFLFDADYRYVAVTSYPTHPIVLYCHPELYDPKEDLKIKPGSNIIVQHRVQGHQLQFLNPNITFTVIEKKGLPETKLWHQEGIQAVCTRALETLPMAGQTPYLAITLHPDEFLEKAGNGLFVFLGHRESIEILKIFRDCFHEKDKVSKANIGRVIARHFFDVEGWELRTRCNQDNRGYYHLRAMLINETTGQTFHHKISQSTSFNLSEKMVQVLSSFIIR